MSTRNYITRKTQNVTESRHKVSVIVKFLKLHRGPHSTHNIRAKTGIDLQKSEYLNVKLALQHNTKVLVSGTTFEYQPTVSGIRNKDELRLYIQKHPQGVSKEDVDDAYVSAKLDISKWIASGRIVHFMNKDTKIQMLHWYYGRLRKHPIQLEKEKEKEEEETNNNSNTNGTKDMNMDQPEEIHDGDVDKELFPLIGDSIIATWNDVKIPPTKEELQRQLEDVKLISGAFSKKRVRQKAAPVMGNRRKRRKMNFNKMNLTNTHMLQDEDLKKSLTAQNNKTKAQNDRELPKLPTQNKPK
eukprot:41018_1